MPAITFFKKISDRWFSLIGDAAGFSFEARVFHSICVGLVVLSGVYAPYNILEGLYVAGAAAALLSVFFFFQYYNSRFRGRPHSNIVFALTGILVFSVSYFSTSGINGSTDLIWPSYLLLVLAISPYRQHLLWIVVYILAFMALHVVEYYYPSLVKHPFDLGKGQFIDRITAFPLPVIAISMILIFIRRSYDKERAAVELRNQQILQQKDLLEQSNAEKNKLLSIISHDMRAPFNNVQGYLQLLNHLDMDNEDRKKVEKELLNVTDQAVDMLSNLLYWSRSQMTGATVQLVEADILNILSKTIEIEKALAARKAIELNSRVDVGIRVKADANMLQLVVRNIISNAVKFTREGGMINIDAQVSGGDCRICIADNGIGIDQDKLDKLFSMTSGSTFGTNNEKGVGLGLPLCKEFMELQGGRIAVESAPGEGSRFFIFIPLGDFYANTTQPL